jgi:hypothetical protein
MSRSPECSEGEASRSRCFAFLLSVGRWRGWHRPDIVAVVAEPCFGNIKNTLNSSVSGDQLEVIVHRYTDEPEIVFLNTKCKRRGLIDQLLRPFLFKPTTLLDRSILLEECATQLSVDCCSMVIDLPYVEALFTACRRATSAPGLTWSPYSFSPIEIAQTEMDSSPRAASFWRIFACSG